VSGGFDGGTLIERFCPAGDFEGPCRVRYNYADDRGLTQGRNTGIVGRTTFDLTWNCAGTSSGTGASARVCSIQSGDAEYMAEALAFRTERWTDKWQRMWSVALDVVDGSVKLPAFRSCDAACNCVSFPRLVWDPTFASEGGQQWKEEPGSSGCADESAQMTAEMTCNGDSMVGRRHGSIHDDSKAEREVGLTQGCSYTDTAGNIIPMGCLYAQYDNLHDVYTADAVNRGCSDDTCRREELQERRNELWVTLGIFQKLYAPWLNYRCAQRVPWWDPAQEHGPDSGMIFEMTMGVDGNSEQTSVMAWPFADVNRPMNVIPFNDYDPTFNYALWANTRRAGIAAQETQALAPIDAPAGSGAPSTGGSGAPPVRRQLQLCANTCTLANNFLCDDGRPSASTSSCDAGTDCADCGPSTAPATTPAPVSPPPSAPISRLSPSPSPPVLLSSDGEPIIDCVWPAGGYGATNRRLDDATDEASHEAPEEALIHAKRKLGRGVGSGSAGAGRLQGCARHATCATRGSRAPPRRP